MTILSDPLVFAATLALFGAAAGLIAGLFGVGGGIVLVPALAALYKTCGFDPDTAIHAAVGVSMMTVVPTSIASWRAHARHDAVDSLLLRQWGAAAAAGSLLGSLAAHGMPGAWIGLIFGAFMAVMAIYLGLVPADLPALGAPPRTGAQKAIALGIGFFSALIGIGGGSLSVPALVLCRAPIHRAIGTASALGFLISLPAALVFVATQTMERVFFTSNDAGPPHLFAFEAIAFALLAPTTMMTAPWGARLSHKLPAAKLKRIFAVLLLAIAVKMLMQSWR